MKSLKNGFKTIPLTIPNLLTIFRMTSSLVLILFAYFGFFKLFYILFILMIASDALDGFFARLLNQRSILGAKLDSYADITTYFSTVISLWLLFPNLMKSEKNYIFIALFLYIFPAVVSILKFKKLSSYHTYLTKISALFMVLGILGLIFFKNSTVFHVGVGFLLLEFIENIAITMKLKEPRVDVKSYWHI